MDETRRPPLRAERACGRVAGPQGEAHPGTSDHHESAAGPAQPKTARLRLGRGVPGGRCREADARRGPAALALTDRAGAAGWAGRRHQGPELAWPDHSEGRKAPAVRCPPGLRQDEWGSQEREPGPARVSTEWSPGLAGAEGRGTFLEPCPVPGLGGQRAMMRGASKTTHDIGTSRRPTPFIFMFL